MINETDSTKANLNGHRDMLAETNRSDVTKLLIEKFRVNADPSNETKLEMLKKIAAAIKDSADELESSLSVIHDSSLPVNVISFPGERRDTDAI